MASEMIKKVLEAERTSADRESATRNKADEIIKAAEAEAKADAETARIAAAAQKEALLKDAEKHSDEIYAKARSEAAAERDRLQSQFSGKREQAVQSVVNHVIPS